MADRDDSLREHLRRLLDWQDAHAGFDDAVNDVPEALRATVPDGSAHSPWQLLDHLRIAQEVLGRLVARLEEHDARDLPTTG